jgi:gamma-glutamyltranspeptidase/glutathione hydrolase
MRRLPTLAVLTLSAVLALPVAVQAAPVQHVVVPTAEGTGGAAATVDKAATDAAIRVLRQGGNAVDATVAAAGVLGVVEPYSCGIGGGGFLMIRTPKGKVTTIDGRETAPLAMRPTSFFEDGKALSFDSARWSGLSAGVPGTPATWDYALKKYGTWSLKRALQPGIRVARDGFVIDQTFFGFTQAAQPWFDDIPSTAALYLDPDGTPHDVGTVQSNPDMAKTYERMAAEGVWDGFYRGPVAKAMAAAAQSPPYAATADHVWRRGLLTSTDVRRYRPVERKPTVVDYRNYRVYGMPPPSSGGTTVGEALSILEHIPGYRTGSALDKLHYYIEASRYAFADRNAYVGDPAFVRVPVKGLLSDSFAAERAALIGPVAANRVVDPGYPWDDEQRVSGPARITATVDHRGQSTTHLSVVDRKGMVATYTFTIESTGGNGIVVPGWGFLLNNELTDFNYDDPKAANAPQAGKRPRSSMAPTYIERNGKPFLVTGSPGGSTIITTVLQDIVNRLDLGKRLPDAIAEPRASQRDTVTTQVEPAFALKYGALEGEPHLQDFAQPVAGSAGEIGVVAAVEFLSHGRLQAATEPVRRGGGNAAVVTR